jgi:hypothetical protein
MGGNYFSGGDVVKFFVRLWNYKSPHRHAVLLWNSCGGSPWCWQDVMLWGTENLEILRADVEDEIFSVTSTIWPPDYVGRFSPKNKKPLPIVVSC